MASADRWIDGRAFLQIQPNVTWKWWLGGEAWPPLVVQDASVASTDTLVLALVEAEALVAGVAGADTVVLTLGDVGALAAVLAGADTVVLTLSEAGTLELVGTDTLILVISDEVGVVMVLVSRITWAAPKLARAWTAPVVMRTWAAPPRSAKSWRTVS